jgi:hypothetical protein
MATRRKSDRLKTQTYAKTVAGGCDLLPQPSPEAEPRTLQTRLLNGRLQLAIAGAAAA